ncbi:hypothetical protein AnigIFM60653_011952 [Aspergillus niger]|nr:hypothetical protein AnigIFM60653_011952 [Aspergillus niger]GLA21551.1 hypothetical protein AnigIFM62618_011220 [Aspergillus niger]GLA44593.1 hypothetical protein AnigIFM63309_004214 [Aspergillus niger]
MSECNDQGQPVKRKREDWAGRGLGHCDSDKISKAADSFQQSSKTMTPPLPRGPLAKDEKIASMADRRSVPAPESRVAATG